MSKKRLPATRFPLLVYQQIFRMLFWPGVLLFVASLLLVVLNPPLLADVRWWFLLLAAIAFLLVLYALLARGSYVQAHPKALRIRAPFYRLVVSYGRISIVRTTPIKGVLKLGSLSRGQRHLVEKLSGYTCIVVETNGYPLSKRVLSLLLHRLLFPDAVLGFAFVVDDWLQLSSELEGARAEWVNRRILTREQRAVEKILRQ